LNALHLGHSLIFLHLSIIFLSSAAFMSASN